MLLRDLAALHRNIAEAERAIGDFLTHACFAGNTGNRLRDMQYARALLQDAQKIVKRYLGRINAELEEWKDAE